MIMANARRPMISYSCLVVTAASSVFLTETRHKFTNLHSTEIKAKLKMLKTRN